jgi:hypothetical protein
LLSLEEKQTIPEQTSKIKEHTGRKPANNTGITGPQQLDTSA